MNKTDVAWTHVAEMTLDLTAEGALVLLAVARAEDADAPATLVTVARLIGRNINTPVVTWLGRLTGAGLLERHVSAHESDRYWSVKP